MNDFNMSVALMNYVNLSGTQTITGTKNFTSIQDNGTALASKYINFSASQTIGGSKTFTNISGIKWVHQ